MAGRRDADAGAERLSDDETDAWFEYLAATRNQAASGYEEIESWAWARLTLRLAAIHARRARVKQAAA